MWKSEGEKKRISVEGPYSEHFVANPRRASSLLLDHHLEHLCKECTNALAVITGTYVCDHTGDYILLIKHKSVVWFG